jgi:hypothetical protein
VRGGIFVDTGSVRVGGKKKRKEKKKKEKQDYGGRRRRPHRYFTSSRLEEGTLVLSLTIL